MGDHMAAVSAMGFLDVLSRYLGSRFNKVVFQLDNSFLMSQLVFELTRCFWSGQRRDEGTVPSALLRQSSRLKSPSPSGHFPARARQQATLVLVG